MSRVSIVVAFASLGLIGAVEAAVAQSAKPAAAAKSWKCTASGLVTASYDGGDSAYVHLTGFSYGGTYPVTKNKAGTVATGTTANGTKFTCTAS